MLNRPLISTQTGAAVAVGMSVALLLAGAGCLGNSTYIPTMYYTVDPEVEAPVAQSCEGTLGVRPLTSARPYAKAKMHYREEGFVIGEYGYDEWAELPATLVTRTVLDAIVSSGRYEDAGYAIDMTAPDFILTGQLRQFVEIRTTTPWSAVCEVRIEVRDTDHGAVLWSGTPSASVPIEGQGPSAFAQAMSKAVGQVVQEAVTQIVTE